MSKMFYLAAAVITDVSHRLLVVRKHKTEIFMLPGGKIEQDETPLDTLIREVEEEINLSLPINLPRFINTYHAPAANEPGYQIESNLFRIKLPDSPDIKPSAEIEEVRWITEQDIPFLNLAPLMESYIIPLWLAEKTDKI